MARTHTATRRARRIPPSRRPEMTFGMIQGAETVGLKPLPSPRLHMSQARPPVMGVVSTMGMKNTGFSIMGMPNTIGSLMFKQAGDKGQFEHGFEAL